MGKKVTTISIDENILRLAKKELPNVSVFVEDCLKAYFGLNKTNVRGIDENLQIIQKALLDIHILSSREGQMEIEKTYGLVEQNKAWSRLFGKYRNSETINIDEYEEVSKILGVTIRDLKELLENIEFNCSKTELVKCNDWEFAKKYI